MEIDNLLKQSNEIWPEKAKIKDIVIRMGVVYGDICRYARGSKKDLRDDQEIKKELGNMIFSSIKWCDDLGFDPKECVDLAVDAQKKFPK